MLKEQPTLDALTRHVDDEKSDRAREVRELPGDARLGDEVIMGGNLYKFWDGTWHRLTADQED